MEIFEVASFVTAIVTLCLMVVCSVWLVVHAFRQHIVWGFAVLLFPVTQIAFAILYWDRVRRPVTIGLVSLAVFIGLLLLIWLVRTVAGA